MHVQTHGLQSVPSFYQSDYSLSIVHRHQNELFHREDKKHVPKHHLKLNEKYNYWVSTNTLTLKDYGVCKAKPILQSLHLKVLMRITLVFLNNEIYFGNSRQSSNAMWLNIRTAVVQPVLYYNGTRLTDWHLLYSLQLLHVCIVIFNWHWTKSGCREWSLARSESNTFLALSKNKSSSVLQSWKSYQIYQIKAELLPGGQADLPRFKTSLLGKNIRVNVFFTYCINYNRGKQ